MTHSTVIIPEIFFCPEVAVKIRRTEAAVRWLWHTGALKSRVVGGRRISSAEDIACFLEGSA
ncbi:hypothetical protein [Microbacterium enclense]|uniref:hypothetical protein n=1 Tax=Microbacterium enclense TaxID=993073 RepID=UPI003440F2B9